MSSVISIVIVGVIYAVLRNSGIHLGAIPILVISLAVFGISRLISKKTEGAKPKEAEQWVCPKCKASNPGYISICKECGKRNQKNKENDIMNKRLFALILCIVLSCAFTLGFAETAPQRPGTSTYADSSSEYTDLSPNNKCPAKPTIYSSARSRIISTDKITELRNGFSVKQINSASDREFGLYFKFTPRSGDHGYRITRFDVVFSEKDGTILYTDGFNTDMVCERGYYWAWKFFPLGGLFQQLKARYGEIKTGTYTMDIYFNRLWAGSTRVKLNK